VGSSDEIFQLVGGASVGIGHTQENGEADKKFFKHTTHLKK
jgi:hypothetical protein